MKTLLKAVASLAVLGALMVTTNAQGAPSHTKSSMKPAVKMSAAKSTKSQAHASGASSKSESMVKVTKKSKTKPEPPIHKRHLKHRASKPHQRHRTGAKATKATTSTMTAPKSHVRSVVRKPSLKTTQPQKIGRDVQRK